MSRIRTIKPEFPKHERLFDAEMEYKLPLRLAFACLWMCCDREGRFEWRPRSLKTDILPYDDIDFSRVLDALWSRGFLEKYVVDGETYGWISSFTRHQVINNKERASILPEPNEKNIINSDLGNEYSRVNHALTTPLENAQGERKGREGNMERKGTLSKGAHQLANNFTRSVTEASESNFAKFRELYPKPGNWDEAQIAWVRKKCDSSAEQIFADIPKRLAEHANWKQGVKFILNPENYLKREEWKNAIIPEPTNENGGKFTEWAQVGTLTGAR